MTNVKLAPTAAWMPFIGATREGGPPVHEQSAPSACGGARAEYAAQGPKWRHLTHDDPWHSAHVGSPPVNDAGA